MKCSILSDRILVSGNQGKQIVECGEDDHFHSVAVLCTSGWYMWHVSASVSHVSGVHHKFRMGPRKHKWHNNWLNAENVFLWWRQNCVGNEEQLRAGMAILWHHHSCLMMSSLQPHDIIMATWWCHNDSIALDVVRCAEHITSKQELKSGAGYCFWQTDWERMFPNWSSGNWICPQNINFCALHNWGGGRKGWNRKEEGGRQTGR